MVMRDSTTVSRLWKNSCDQEPALPSQGLGNTKYKTDYLSPWVSVDDSASWLTRVKLNTRGEFVKQDSAKNSILIWYEWPESILEYSPGKMIATLRPNRFLFLDDWLPVRHIE